MWQKYAGQHAVRAGQPDFNLKNALPDVVIDLLPAVNNVS
jgi:hypothetical protein